MPWPAADLPSPDDAGAAIRDRKTCPGMDEWRSAAGRRARLVAVGTGSCRGHRADRPQAAISVRPVTCFHINRSCCVAPRTARRYGQLSSRSPNRTESTSAAATDSAASSMNTNRPHELRGRHYRHPKPHQTSIRAGRLVMHPTRCDCPRSRSYASRVDEGMPRLRADDPAPRRT